MMGCSNLISYLAVNLKSRVPSNLNCVTKPLSPVNVSASSHGIQLLVGEVPEVMPGSGWEVKQVATSLVPLLELWVLGLKPAGTTYPRSYKRLRESAAAGRR